MQKKKEQKLIRKKINKTNKNSKVKSFYLEKINNIDKSVSRLLETWRGNKKKGGKREREHKFLAFKNKRDDITTHPAIIIIRCIINKEVVKISI